MVVVVAVSAALATLSFGIGGGTRRGGGYDAFDLDPSSPPPSLSLCVLAAPSGSCIPWFLVATPPQHQKTRDESSSAPPDTLLLSRVFGYCSETSRNNVKYTACGAVIYPAGGTVIRVDIGNGGQSFGTFHAGFEICALTISKDRSKVATCDISREP